MSISLELKNKFYSELYENNNVNTKDIENTINTCKITDMTLEDNFIELDCGHKFNYLALFQEIKYQKTNKYSLSYDFTKLNINQIKCPYCRSITNKILPYFKYYNVDMIKGVNFPFKYCMKINECKHLLKTSKRCCNNSACITPIGILCNNHYNQKNKNIDKDIDKSIEKMKVVELKQILKKNNCKVSGKKCVLIERIYNEKNKNLNWVD